MIINITAYLFTEGGIVVALHTPLVEGKGYHGVSQGSEEGEQSTGHGVGGAWELPATSVKHVHDVLNLRSTTTIRE